MKRNIFPLVKVWYFSIGLIFIFFLCNMYYAAYSNQNIVLGSFLFFLIFVLVSSMLPFFGYTFVIKENLPYLESSIFLKTFFYIFFLIAEIFYGQYILPLGFSNIILEVLLGCIFFLLLMSISIDSIYLEKYISNGAISKEYLVKSQIFFVIVMIFTYILYLIYLNLNYVSKFFFPAIPLGGDCILYQLFRRLEMLGINESDKQFSVTGPLYISIFFSKKFYLFIIIPLSFLIFSLSFLYHLDFVIYLTYFIFKMVLVVKFLQILHKSPLKP